MRLRCTGCDAEYRDVSDALSPCPRCGAALRRSGAHEDQAWGAFDVYVVLRWQRWFLVVVGLLAVNGFILMMPFGVLPPDAYAAAGVSYALINVVAAVMAYGLLRACRINVATAVISLLLAFIPYFGFIVLLGANGQTVSALRKCGVRAGFLGTREVHVATALHPHLCRNCEYDLTGNVSNICPECGAAVPAWVRRAALPPGIPIHRRGEMLVTPTRAELPRACVHCGSTTDLRYLRKTYHWHAPAWYWLLFWPGFIIYFVVAPVVRRQAVIGTWLCRRHNRRRRKILTCLCAGMALCLALVATAIIYELFEGVFFALLLLISLLVILACEIPVLKPLCIDYLRAEFLHASPDFLALLPEYPGSATQGETTTAPEHTAMSD